MSRWEPDDLTNAEQPSQVPNSWQNLVCLAVSWGSPDLLDMRPHCIRHPVRKEVGRLGYPAPLSEQPFSSVPCHASRAAGEQQNPNPSYRNPLAAHNSLLLNRQKASMWSRDNLRSIQSF